MVQIRTVLIFLILFILLGLSELTVDAYAYVFDPESSNPGRDSVYLSHNSIQSIENILAVDVRVNSLSVAPAMGAAFDLDFDSTVLTYDGFIPGDFFENGDIPENGSIIRLVRVQTSNPNKLVVGVTQNRGDSEVSGSGVILTLKFRVATGTQIIQEYITFSNMSLMDTNGLPIEGLTWYKGQLVQEPLAIVSSTLPEGTQGMNYSATLNASGGFPPYTWMGKGTIPPGLKFDSNTGVIYGDPTTTGSYAGTIYLTDSTLQEITRDITLIINPPPAISTTYLPEATIGQAYEQNLSGTGGTPPILWDIISGNLPPGIRLDGARGIIEGIPVTAGTYLFTIQLSDANGAIVNSDLIITVNPEVAINTSTLPQTTVSAFYNVTLQADGGTSPYIWDVPTGLPPGLNLIPGSGEILGIPSAAGNWQFSVNVIDANGSSTSQDMMIMVNPKPDIMTYSPAILYQDSPGTEVTLTAAGGVSPYTWNIDSGNLPLGLVLNGQTGKISGSPVVPGIYLFTIKVTDAIGVSSSTQFSWPILANPPGNADFTTPGSEDRVDGYDMVVVEMVIGETVGSGGWNPLADFDMNGVVDDLDRIILSNNFGQSITP